MNTMISISLTGGGQLVREHGHARAGIDRPKFRIYAGTCLAFQQDSFRRHHRQPPADQHTGRSTEEQSLLQKPNLLPTKALLEGDSRIRREQAGAPPPPEEGKRSSAILFPLATSLPNFSSSPLHLFSLVWTLLRERSRVRRRSAARLVDHSEQVRRNPGWRTTVESFLFGQAADLEASSPRNSRLPALIYL